ncbi:PAS-domain containing protein [Gymnodinialimonas ceratoperidinii]|uniref:PAS-domain containing protein n=1 Tax=Gymnodinialimonas ceratoperidinii TaxID=2856823 RepID=A0A8F6TWD7_9RHOB|nr:PAS-domain containing protein [Gymnodinialimonas ceratoperidinii]QXT40167.1 PAS-domain containing protein [Gymnodinialimonas ceratoperidinii]
MDNAATLIFIGITLATAAMGVVLTTRLLAGRLIARSGGAPPRGSGNSDVLRRYRFREGYLLSDVDRDDAFLDHDIDRTMAFKRLVSSLVPISPDLKPHLTALQDRGDAFVIEGRIGSDPVLIGGRLEEDDVLSLSVGPADKREGRQTVEAATLSALQAELSDLRAALDTGVVPMWREDRDARVIWANASYFDLLERQQGGDAPCWPLPRVFASALEEAPTEGTIRRCSIAFPDRDEPTWYEVSRDELPGGSALFTAQPADRLVRAETNLRHFLQTTTKTFAALPVGLAVFDRKRQLVTFNPALVALTQVGAEFLSARPDLRSFLDQLREMKRMPEPRDYRSWRDEIAQLEEGAENGTYRQLWELPEGKTFRVMGRPHPDGAIAFMFEDISAEVSLTRQFRADLDMFQAVLDAIPAAIAVFQADGAMVGANEGYGRLWGQDPQDLAQMPHLNQTCQDWAKGCKPSPVWGEIRQFVGHEIERAPWVEEIETLNGMRLAVRMAPTRGRATVIQFHPLDINVADPLAELGVPPATPLLDAARAQVPEDTQRRA